MPGAARRLLNTLDAPDKVVTGPHADWMELPEDQQVYTEAAIDHVARVLRKEFKYDRTGRYSPSSLGLCQRRVLFGYAGAPQVGDNLDSLDLMGLGTWGHLRWQAEGISAGWMKEGEFWKLVPEWRLGGSMDGILFDDTIFELKTAGYGIYKKVVVDAGGPKDEALVQTEAYFRLKNHDQRMLGKPEVWMASVVYEERASGQFEEFRIERDEPMVKRVDLILEQLDDHVDRDTLPRMLSDCENRTGNVYRQCPYRKFCPTRTTVSLEC